MNKRLINKEDRLVILKFFQEMKLGEFLFKDESLQRKVLAEINKKNKKRKQKKQACSFPCCDNLAIQKSHTLSDKLMLEPISENEHVYTIKVDTFNGKNIIDKVSIHGFSTFPGFCEKHENLFTFEKEGRLTNGKELQMQLFRSICRQLHFLEYEKDNLTTYLETIEPFLEQATKNWYEKSIMKSDYNVILNLIKDHFLSSFRLMIKHRKLDIDFTRNVWYKPNANNFGNVIDYNLFHDELIVVPKHLPFVLSGPVLFNDCDRDIEGTPNFEKLYYVNLFPNENKTLIHLASLRTQKERIVLIAETFENSFEEGSRYIQRWLMENLDLWALKPSYWENTPLNIKEEIGKKLSISPYETETRIYGSID